MCKPAPLRCGGLHNLLPAIWCLYFNKLTKLNIQFLNIFRSYIGVYILGKIINSNSFILVDTCRSPLKERWTQLPHFSFYCRTRDENRKCTKRHKTARESKCNTLPLSTLQRGVRQQLDPHDGGGALRGRKDYFGERFTPAGPKGDIKHGRHWGSY